MKRHKQSRKSTEGKERLARQRTVGRKQRAPRTAAEYFARPQRFQDIWNRVTHVISKVRADGKSLQRASRDVGISPRTVLRLGGTAFRKRKNGRYAARRSDRLLRVLLVPTQQGVREVAVRDSRQASLLAAYWDAVQRYLQIGDTNTLAKYQGMYIIDADRNRVLLLTDGEDLDRLGSAGVLSFESLYARSA